MSEKIWCDCMKSMRYDTSDWKVCPKCLTPRPQKAKGLIAILRERQQRHWVNQGHGCDANSNCMMSNLADAALVHFLGVVDKEWQHETFHHSYKQDLKRAMRESL